MTISANERFAGAGREEDHAASLLPPVDVIEDVSGITLFADMPGVSREALHVSVDAETLTIEGRVDLAVPEGMAASHTEVGLPGYRRVFSLSKELDGEKMSAELKHGVLKLSIPKVEHVQPRRIDIRVE